MSLLIPGSLAYFTTEAGMTLSPLAALMNLVNPFEAMWILLAGWRLRWLTQHGRSPLGIAVAVWALATLPFWMVTSLLPALL